MLHYRKLVTISLLSNKISKIATTTRNQIYCAPTDERRQSGPGMNHSLATTRPPRPPPSPSLTMRGDGPSNGTLRFVDDVHRRVNYALSQPNTAGSVEETWSAIKNSPAAARLTEEVIRPMFMSPFDVADVGENAGMQNLSSGRPNTTPETARKENIPRTLENELRGAKAGSKTSGSKIGGKPGTADSAALEAKKRKSQWQRHGRHRNPQRKKILYSPLYPFKIFQPRKKQNRRNRQDSESRKRRRRPNIKNGISGYQRPRQSRPSRPSRGKNEGHTRRGEPDEAVKQPYEFWQPQKNFFSVQIPTVQKHTNQRRHEKRRQKHGNNSEKPKELELYWSDHLRDMDRDREEGGKSNHLRDMDREREGAKRSRRRKHRGEATRKDAVVPSQHVVQTSEDGEGHTNIVIRVLIHLLKNCYLETSAIVYYYHYNE